MMMEAIRTTMNSGRLASIIDLPESLINREVEVIVLPTIDYERKQNRKENLESLCGSLSQYADPALREQEEGAWERAAVEKYLSKMQDDRS